MTHTQGTNEHLQRVAALNALATLIGDELKRAKADLGSQVVRGTLYVLADPADPQSPVLGSFTMSKPRQGAPRIVDEQLAMSWVLENFGETGMVEVRLSEQGRKSAIEAARSGRHEVPGVELPAPGKPVATFRQDSDAKAEVVAMWQRGELVLDTMLSLDEGADQ